ncbi:CAP domain-containing protein [Streptomyces sp. 1222.5]|uniref:CAP domain-containing protein n=1 Tax=Streptomyces sp. 1222.5 TaxID=1881026 RepID=UPI003EC152B9
MPTSATPQPVTTQPANKVTHTTHRAKQQRHGAKKNEVKSKLHEYTLQRATKSPSAEPSLGATAKTTAKAANEEQTQSDQVIALVNAERAEAGCGPVKANAQLTKAAQAYTDTMAASGHFSHVGADGSTLSSRVAAAGYHMKTVGENIAYGQPNAAAVMDAWMNSPGHRGNILNCDFQDIGVGIGFGTGTIWWTEDFGTTT